MLCDFAVFDGSLRRCECYRNVSLSWRPRLRQMLERGADVEEI